MQKLAKMPVLQIKYAVKKKEGVVGATLPTLQSSPTPAEPRPPTALGSATGLPYSASTARICGFLCTYANGNGCLVSTTR